jgi:hypothetical protein
MGSAVDASSFVAPEGSKLTEAQRDALSDLLTQAQRHDVVVDDAFRAVREAVQGPIVKGAAAHIEALLDEWQDAISELNTIIGSAATATVLALFSPHDDWSVGGLRGEELEAVLKPIFDESGIAHRFIRDPAG